MLYTTHRVKNGQIGLTFRDNEIIDITSTGSTSIWFKESFLAFNLEQEFLCSISNEVVKKNTKLMKLLHHVDIEDDEFVVVLINGKYRFTLHEGEHFYWNTVLKYDFIRFNSNDLYVTQNVSEHIKQKLHVQGYLHKCIVEENQTVLLKVDGKVKKVVEAGTHYFIKGNKTISTVTIDNRNKEIELSGQELMTKDKASIRVSFFVNYKVNDTYKALTAFIDYDKQLYTAFQLALREYVGLLTLDDLISKRDEHADMLKDLLESKSKTYAISINNLGIRDIILPGDMREMMNKVILAEKNAQANSIMRREETASTRSLLNTAKLMDDNTMLYKLKEMEYMEKIADKITGISVNGNSQILDQLKTIFTK